MSERTMAAVCAACACFAMRVVVAEEGGSLTLKVVERFTDVAF